LKSFIASFSHFPQIITLGSHESNFIPRSTYLSRLPIKTSGLRAEARQSAGGWRFVRSAAGTSWYARLRRGTMSAYVGGGSMVLLYETVRRAGRADQRDQMRAGRLGWNCFRGGWFAMSRETRAKRVQQTGMQQRRRLSAVARGTVETGELLR
jgi:hypothetical protein